MGLQSTHFHRAGAVLQWGYKLEASDLMPDPIPR